MFKQLMDTQRHTYVHHQARKSIMLKTGKMPQRHDRNLIWTAGWGRRMNNSDSLIHLTKFCQPQAETYGLWAGLPQLKGNTSSLLNGKPAVPTLKVGDGRNDKPASRINWEPIHHKRSNLKADNVFILSLAKEKEHAYFIYAHPL